MVNALNELTDRVLSGLTERLNALRVSGSEPPVILCIGSDRVTGDCLGPLVGHILTRELNADAFVYGSLSSPVNALNLVETVSFIKSRHPYSPVIAVDSSLGERCDIGAIRIINDGIYPGAAAGKSLPKVGNIAITATVAELKRTELYGVRLGFVYPLAQTIAAALSGFLKTA